MKIAILMFGQPRFLDRTVNLIKENFDLPNHTVHYFTYFWDHMGYMPKVKELQYNKTQIYDLVKSIPGATLPTNPSQKNIVITDYEELDSVCNNILEFIRLHKRNLPISRRCEIADLRYKFGQHWSMKKCFDRIVSYEKENNFKYDIIIKVRTDIVYSVKENYRDEEEYYKIKDDMYTNLDFNVPMVKCTALRYVDLTERLNGESTEHNIPMRAFYNNHVLFHKNEDIKYDPLNEVGWTKHTENYKQRLAFNDWTLIANREGAEIMFGNWFENYFLTLTKDIKNNNKSDWFISQSDHCLQGQIAINYNLAVRKISPRRDIRLIHPNIANVKRNIQTHGKVKARSEEQIRGDIMRHKFK